MPRKPQGERVTINPKGTINIKASTVEADRCVCGRNRLTHTVYAMGNEVPEGCTGYRRVGNGREYPHV